MSVGKALYRRWIDEVWTHGDVSLLDQLHTPAFRDRTDLRVPSDPASAAPCAAARSA